MILDTMDNAGLYAGLSEGLGKALKALADYSQDPYVTGRTEIDGTKLFLLANAYETKPLGESSRMEAHRAYIDVMYMVEGEEMIYVKPTDRLTSVEKEYTPAMEALLALVDDDCTAVRLQKGQFVVLFPEDAHCPSCCVGEPAGVKKIIGKLAVDY